MARAIFQNIGGGGGGSSEDCTATKNKVLEGYTAITSDSNDEPATGTAPNLSQRSSITHQSGNSTPVILGTYAYVSQCSDNVTRAQIQLTGTDGYVLSGTCVGIDQSKMATAAGATANKILSGQSILGVTGTATSDATATANYIYTGKTAYKNGQKITGTMTVNSILSFDYAAYSTTQIIVKWQNPSKGPFSGVVICAKTGGYPTSPDDNRKYTGYGDNKNASAWSNTIIGGLTPGTTYYFRMWWYATCSAGDMFSSSAKLFTCSTTAHGRKTFTSSGTWTVPAGVTSINIHCTGGGASGASGYNPANTDPRQGGDGGGGGYTSYKKNISVSQGQRLSIVVGNGGVASTNYYMPVAGGTSSVSLNNKILVSANGGNTKVPGSPESSVTGAYTKGCGGSGGGRGALPKTSYPQAYAGGSNGSNGGWNSGTRHTHLGQGTSTREFGESNGTLYSGGGGGGGCTAYISSSESDFIANYNVGGDGGGGDGDFNRKNDMTPGKTWYESGYYEFEYGAGAPGRAGSGGGGGGGSAANNFQTLGGNGGSGNVIITW